MHDEDCAIGLSVQNTKGETWTIYGDKRVLDVEDSENKTRCLAAVQASADEIYDAWKTKQKPATYKAWSHAPTLESAAAHQVLAPLFRVNNQILERRKTIKDRRDWTFITPDNYSMLDTWKECELSGWWKYPITIDGPSWLLSGSSVTSTTTSAGNCQVYYQDAQGGIRQSIHGGAWVASNSGLFTAKMFTPLAVVAWKPSDYRREVSDRKVMIMNILMIADSRLLPFPR
jgi:hypothetical protein